MSEHMDPDIDPLSLRPAYIALIVDIMYHAIKDKRLLEEPCVGFAYGECLCKEPCFPFADDDHKTFCVEEGYDTGADELRDFALSPWFERLFEELEQTDMDDVRGILTD